MDIRRFSDICGLRLLIFLVCYMITGIDSPPAALHIIAAAAAALAAAGAVRDLIVRDASPRSAKERPNVTETIRSALSGKNARRFVIAALILAVLSFVIPFPVPYVVGACVCTLLAVVCLARRRK